MVNFYKTINEAFDGRYGKSLTEASAAHAHPDMSKKLGSISSMIIANKDRIDNAASLQDLRAVVEDILSPLEGNAKVTEINGRLRAMKDHVKALQYIYNIILKGDNLGTIKTGKAKERSKNESMNESFAKIITMNADEFFKNSGYMEDDISLHPEKRVVKVYVLDLGLDEYEEGPYTGVEYDDGTFSVVGPGYDEDVSSKQEMKSIVMSGVDEIPVDESCDNKRSSMTEANDSMNTSGWWDKYYDLVSRNEYCSRMGCDLKDTYRKGSKIDNYPDKLVSYMIAKPQYADVLGESGLDSVMLCWDGYERDGTLFVGQEAGMRLYDVESDVMKAVNSKNESFRRRRVNESYGNIFSMPFAKYSKMSGYTEDDISLHPEKNVVRVYLLDLGDGEDGPYTGVEYDDGTFSVVGLGYDEDVNSKEKMKQIVLSGMDEIIGESFRRRKVNESSKRFDWDNLDVFEQTKIMKDFVRKYNGTKVFEDFADYIGVPVDDVIDLFTDAESRGFIQIPQEKQINSAYANTDVYESFRRRRVNESLRSSRKTKKKIR